MPSRDTAQGAFIKSSFGTVWPVHLAGFTRLLVQLRKRFDGDLDLVLVLAVIGSRTLPERWVPALDELTQMTRLDDTETRQLPINIQSVAEYSGIPRETVRRKVVTLQEKGWVARGADGCLTVTRGAACDLEAATGDTIASLASLLLAFEAAKVAGADEE
ncbi:hypothetical protein [Rhodovulum marinum]|uniref:HTH crp-type domain-containing protein n=1 Tax=Rhodovulum marinum TaxID=320662 RepID=A0A4R2PT53_9RHOB|nr:hypothetical protein [Rhodovulum marinum]TCP39080.1 hypothetical protein EV662_1146 [Rhodovulum marinum]